MTEEGKRSSKQNTAKGETIANSELSTQSTQATPKVHYLQYTWTHWYVWRSSAPNRAHTAEKDSYEATLKPLGSFNTIEDFWRYQNHIIRPSRQDYNTNYHLFKKGIKPMWEDSANINGGKWIIFIRNEARDEIDEIWERVLIALIGGQLEEEEELCGVVLSRRKVADKIAIWNRDRNNEEAILRLGKRLREFVDSSKAQLSYQNHEDSIRTWQNFNASDRYSM